MSSPAVVAVLGGGASGCLVSAQLARAATAAGRSLHILVVEPEQLGRGLAYCTTDPRHRLNVAAAGMSALPDDSEHFLRWMRRHVAVDFPATGFAPRMHYATYLRHCLDRALSASTSVTLEHVDERATGVRRHGSRLLVALSGSGVRPADAVVLAAGHPDTPPAWASAGLRLSDRFVSDPWRRHRPVPVPDDGDVVLVGAGLTMADMAFAYGREGVRVHVVSRHGLLPLPHLETPQPGVPLPDPAAVEAVRSLGDARRLVLDHVARVRSAGGDWRSAIDGLRPVTGRLWQKLPEQDRARFVASGARRWDRVRHRVDPALHAWLQARVQDASLVSHRASVAEAVPCLRSIRVTLTDGSVLDAAAMVNCTGVTAPTTTSTDPLIRSLLDAGLAAPGPLDLGLATSEHGRLRAAGDDAPIWAVGPLRRGELWESTAIPEIRTQAQDLAVELVEQLAVWTGVRRAPAPGGCHRALSA